jgi:hemerythrin-like domain-containing protein
MKSALNIIRDEHRSISAVLSALKELAKAAQDSAVRPEFEVFHAMIYYIDQFPERLHHPKEDQVLFVRVEKRAPEAKRLLDDLRAEHSMGAQLIRDLEQSLVGLEVGWQGGAQAFVTAVDAYADFHWKHMRKEEKELLPLAERVLTKEDWAEIDAAFAGNEDPIADLREKDFENLFSRIVSLAPAPVGVGASWKRADA